MLEDLAKHDKHDAPAEGADGVTDVVSEEDKAKEGKYTKFYAEFGAVLKEGLGEDFANRERLAKLLRFASTTSDTVSVSFADYKARMKEGQEAIYYITSGMSQLYAATQIQTILLDIITCLGTDREIILHAFKTRMIIFYLPQQHPVVFYEVSSLSLNTEIEVLRAIITQV
jgi:hypothetical protein